MRSYKKAGTRSAWRNRQQVAEELERRVMLASALAAFGAQVTFGVGSQPRGVVTADVNSDGKLDLVVTNGAAGTVGVMLGNGNGTFGGQATFSVGTTPFGVVAADVNRDGKLDLAVANSGSDSVSVLLGNGNGTFGGQQTLSTGVGGQPRAVAVADMTGDGKPDLVAANYGAGNVWVVMGNGNGTFFAPKTFSAGAQPSSMVLGDFNRDGRIDVAVANKGAGTVSLLVNGIAGLLAPMTFAAGSAPFALAAADMNMDGRADLVVAEEGTGVGVMLGNGNGTFGAQLTAAVGSVPASVALGDINGDGKVDVAVGNYASNTISVLLGNGNGKFYSNRTFATGAEPFALAAADLNRDGRMDLAAANLGGGSVGVLLDDPPPYVVSINRSNPATQSTTATSVTFALTFSEPVTGVDATDFSLAVNGTGATTPVVVSGGGASYSVTVNGIYGSGTLGLNLLDDGSIQDSAGDPLQAGTVGFVASPATPSVDVGPDEVRIADLNMDGKPDVAVLSSSRNKLEILAGNGDGIFHELPFLPTGSLPEKEAVADFNGDGIPDLAVTNASSLTVSVFIGNGNGTYGAGVTYSAGPNADGIAAADLNGDGAIDLVISDNNGPTSGSMMMLGWGNGTFQSTLPLGTGNYGVDVESGDVNGDGKADMLIVAYGGGGGAAGSVRVLLGTGSGLGAQVTYAAGNSPTSCALADVNGDGRLDVVVADRAGGCVSVLAGNGNGTFGLNQTFASGAYTASVAVADVNGDGKLDVVVTNSGKFNAPMQTVGVLLGDGTGQFGAPMTFTVGSRPFSVAVGDLNHDGRMDLVTADYASSTVSVLLGNTSGGLAGQAYTIVPPPATINGTSGADVITLRRDVDGTDVDWQMGGSGGVVPIAYATGIVINGNGGSDVITLDYTNGNPLPNVLHLNGTLTVNGMQGASPLAGTTVEIGRSTVWISYSGNSPASVIRAALAGGYNGGAWNGTSAGGVITSSAAAANGNRNTGIGWADSGDGSGVNTVANSIELKYTINGDANLNGVVDIFDLNALLGHYNKSGDWTGGDSTYNGQVDIFDLNALLWNYNTNLGSQVVPAVGGAAASTSASSPAVTAEAVNAGEMQTRRLGEKETRRKWGTWGRENW